jgi:formylglycine-generating enzyme required for sulfatase activity
VLSSAASAQEASADLARLARQVLDKHCYACHGKEGKAEAGVFVLNRDRLVERKKVLPGNPERSRLFKAILDEEMPPSEVKVRPSAGEVAVLRRWIAAGAPDFTTAVARRDFITEQAILELLRDDQQALPGRDRRFARYFTLTHLHNAGVGGDELDSYRHGLSKLVNSLSWGRDIVRPIAIDPAKTIFRIDLRRYRWDAETWTATLAGYPYGVAHDSAAARAICTVSGSPLPYVRGDWFVFAASRPPLYHAILGIPATDRELEKRLEIDVDRNIRQDLVARAGFSSSGVSKNNRLIERHRSSFGAYWKSYDFAGNQGRQNLFKHPLGPGGGDAFEADGGEIIFSLPNGLQGYMLVDGRGGRLDRAPIAVVSTRDRRNPEVVNGIACMACHARGMIFKDDQVRKAVEASDAFDKEARETVQALYPLKAAFDKLLEADAARFKKAVEQTGDRVQKTDTVVLLARRFEEELDVKLAAAEVGLPPAVFLRGLKRSPDLSRALAPLRVGGTVQRDTFVEMFGDIVHELKLGTFRGGLHGNPGEIVNSIGMKLVRIPPGTFRMGAPRSEAGGEDEPEHEVTITRAFHLGVYEVTQEEYQKVMGSNPSYFSATGEGKAKVKGTDTRRFPVENVSWEDAVLFCEKLSALAKEKAAGRLYRLPTEAEWEHACRAGTKTAFHFGGSLSSKEANFDGKYPFGGAAAGSNLGRTAEVGSYAKNAFGLCDMHGNVMEWCADWFDGGYYRASPKNDPPGPKRGKSRVLRGGSWEGDGRSCRAAARSWEDPRRRDDSIGFRVACVPVGAAPRSKE